MRSTVATTIGNTQVKYALLALIDEADGDIKAAQANIERWFDDAMVRVAGWYKRKTQVIILAVAAVITLALNADTFIVAKSLWNDSALPESVVTAARQATDQPLPDEIQAIEQELAKLQLPLGWHSAPCWLSPSVSCDLVGGSARIVGLLFTAVALSLGAPFWFDLLNKFISFRTSGEPISTKPEDTKRMQ